MTLIEDIFEAEDSLAVDIQTVDLPKEFFSSLTIDCNRPQLQHNLIRKLTKYISQLAYPSRRSRRAAREVGTNNCSGSKSRETLSDIESTVLLRVMKILERSIKLGENLDPFHTLVPRTAMLSSPVKEGQKQPTLRDDHELEVDSHSPPREMSDQRLTESELHNLSTQLEIARDSILAAECCIALLSGEGLTKQVSTMTTFHICHSSLALQLYSEELITTCLGTIKNHLTMIVYPFVEGPGTSAATSPQLQFLYQNSHPSCMDLRRLLSELFQVLSAALPRVNTLFSADGIMMSDSIIIQAVYIAIGPFFVVESSVHESDTKGKKDNPVLSTLGSSAMRGLRLDALSIIRSVRQAESSNV